MVEETNTQTASCNCAEELAAMEALMVNITDPKVDEMSFEDLKQALKEEVARRKVFLMDITNLKSLLE